MTEATTATKATDGGLPAATRITSRSAANQAVVDRAASIQAAAQAAIDGGGLEARRTVSEENVAPEDDDAIGRKVEDYPGDDDMGLVDRRLSREWGAFLPCLVDLVDLINLA
jgi:hypothetical protein